MSQGLSYKLRNGGKINFTTTMISRRVISKGVRYVDCPQKFLSPYVCPSGLAVRSIATSSSLKPSLRRTTWSRTFGQTATDRPEVTGSTPGVNGLPTQAEALANDEETQDPQQNLDPDEDPRTKDSTPWYLQVEPPERESVSLLQRQKLPDVPPNPPPLLQPMLEHIFLDLGLDDLTLFDLRGLDPPAALGANLVMVICTARSEKHLHVSADKFCQWVKKTHQITPYADGLLGRGELKLKLKRKAKRARILSQVGATETKQTDDGIRTGWICVTVENLEDGKPFQEIEKTSDDYVGFGGEESGAKVVIQMLTQEKREELDLEDLWGKMLRRNERRQDRISQGPEDSESQQEVGQNPLFNKSSRSDSSSVAVSSSSTPLRASHSQVRHMHSSATNKTTRVDPSDRNYSEAAALSHPGPEATASNDIPNGPLETDGHVTALSAEDGQAMRDHSSEGGDASNLKAHVEFAESLSHEDALAALGNGAQDTDSTSFLRSFHASLPAFPTAEQWGIRLSLLCLGIHLGAPGYDKHQLILLFRKIQSSLIKIPSSLYMQTLTALLTPGRSEDNDKQPYLNASSLHAAASILEEMQSHGHDITLINEPDSQIRQLLELAVLQADPDAATSPSPHPEAPQRLRRLLQKIYRSPPSLDLELRKMRACASSGNYQGMWDIWRTFAIDMRPRPVALYTAMFHHFADLGHQAKTADALRALVPEMAREEPRVRMDREIAEAVKRCVLVVDPRAEEEAVSLRGGSGMGELQRLWARCESVIQEERMWARESDDD